jgi:hypothetical protein
MTAVDEGVLSVEPSPRERQFDGRWLTNTDPVLRTCWHPVAAAAEVGETPMQITHVRSSDDSAARRSEAAQCVPLRRRRMLAPGWLRRGATGR